MFRLLNCLLLISCLGCRSVSTNMPADKESINKTLDQWHAAAGRADFKNYFELMDDQATFMGTDATENWNKKDFMAWSKPYFDKGKAWNFKSVERNIYFDHSGTVAWFDELLSTQMKICRGSGVMVKKGKDWKIEQYVLSMTIPNDLSDSIVRIKSPIEDGILQGLNSK